jgi:hypothetical protein
VSVNLGGKAADEAHSLILAAGLKEGFEGSRERLNIDVEKAGLNLRIPMPDSFHEPEGVSTADLGTPQVPNGFISTPNALQEGNFRGYMAVGWAVNSSLGPKHLIQFVSGDYVLEDSIAILRLSPCIKKVNACRDKDGRGVEHDSMAIPLNLGVESTWLAGHPFEPALGHDFDLGPSVHLLDLIVHHTGKAFVTFL